MVARCREDDPARHQATELGAVSLSRLQGVERLTPQRQAVDVLLEPAPHLAVQIPAQVVERLGERFDLVLAEPAEIGEPDHHVGHLHPGVVDVVLDLDLVAEGPQDARQHVSEDGVAQMPDVRRLVGIDVRVLDDPLARALFGRQQVGLEQLAQDGSAIEEGIEKAGTLNPDLPDALRQLESVGDFGGDQARRLLQLARQGHRHRRREIAEIAPRRDLDGGLHLDAVELFDSSGDPLAQGLSQLGEHRESLFVGDRTFEA